MLSTILIPWCIKMNKMIFCFCYQTHHHTFALLLSRFLLCFLSVNQDCILFNSFTFTESIELIVKSVNALKPEMVMSAGRHYGTRKSTTSGTFLQSVMKWRFLQVAKDVGAEDFSGILKEDTRQHIEKQRNHYWKRPDKIVYGIWRSEVPSITVDNG